MSLSICKRGPTPFPSISSPPSFPTDGLETGPCEFLATGSHWILMLSFPSPLNCSPFLKTILLESKVSPMIDVLT